MSYSFLRMLEDLTAGYDIPLRGREISERRRSQYYVVGIEAPKPEHDAKYLKALPYREFLKTDYWRSVKITVYTRRGRACSKCNAKHGIVDLHHRSYAHHGEELKYLDDLIVLCRKCHKYAHTEAICMNCLCQRGKGLVITARGDIRPCPDCSMPVGYREQPPVEETCRLGVCDGSGWLVVESAGRSGAQPCGCRQSAKGAA